MKVDPKEFAIYNNQRPKILLLGNGFNRISGDNSWNDLLNSMRDDKFIFDADEYQIPNGLKASMLSNGKLQGKIEEFISKEKEGNKLYKNDDQVSNQLYYDFASLNFDYILTTNYSYEIELAINNKNELSEERIKDMLNYHGDLAERRYAIRTFNTAVNEEFSRNIWHIHGEYCRPQSIILGQLYYGNLLSKYKKSLDGIENLEIEISNSQISKINNWIEAFIFGDVYIVGLGMDFAEVDLWWLLEEKFLNKNKGKTYFYNPKEKAFQYNKSNNDKNEYIELNKYEISELEKIKNNNNYSKTINPAQCKKYLMDAYEVKYQDLNYIPTIADHSYLEFYKLVLKDIESKINKK